MVKNLGLCLKNPVPVSKKLKMTFPYICNNAYIRRRNGSKDVHFTEVIDSHLKNRYFIIFIKSKNGKGKSQGII